MEDLPLHSLLSYKSLGSYGAFQMEIEVGGTGVEDVIKSDEVYHATRKANELIMGAIFKARMRTSEEGKEQTKWNRKHILACFPERIFVEEIPNGYSADYHLAHIPWFVVTTSIGRFTVGSRKRVYHLSWEGTKGKKARDLFPDEDVTKDGQSIHAWDLEKLKEYVAKVIASAEGALVVA